MRQKKKNLKLVLHFVFVSIIKEIMQMKIYEDKTHKNQDVEIKI